MQFETFSFDGKIMTGIRALGYTTPTPIQQQAMPPVLEGRDVMGTAQTGTGKTAAFVLPILQRLIDRAPGNVRALIIAPTRELTEQTAQVVRALGRHTRHRGMSIYGGVSMQPQVKTLRGGVDIVSACPGRLLDHAKRGTIDLSTVEVLVLDEADQMFDMGFLPDIRKIIALLPAKRQTLLFSATMPEAIQKLARDILRDPVMVQIGHERPVETVSQAFYAVESGGKTVLLQNILNTSAASSVLVFTRTKHRAKTLARQLEKKGFGATALHGNLSQNKRQQALDDFKSGGFRVLVATDIAARGIDVAGISHVVNYDMPDTAQAYTHRVGRTGRAEKTGAACSFVTRDDRDLVRSLERSLGEKLQLQKTEPAIGKSVEAQRDDRHSDTRQPRLERKAKEYKQPMGSAVRSGRSREIARSERRPEQAERCAGPTFRKSDRPTQRHERGRRQEEWFSGRAPGKPFEKKQHRPGAKPSDKAFFGKPRRPSSGSQQPPSQRTAWKPVTREDMGSRGARPHYAPTAKGDGSVRTKKKAGFSRTISRWASLMASSK